MNLKTNVMQLNAPALVAPIVDLAGVSGVVDNGVGWQSTAPVVSRCASEQEFAPECWRNFVSGASFSLNNFDRAF
jgi:hypothetical protein